MYSEVLSRLLNKFGPSAEFKESLLAFHGSGVSDFRLRESRVQVQNGDWIVYQSYYARSHPEGVDGYLSRAFWGIEQGASLAFRSLLSAFSVINISFAIGTRKK